MSRNVVMLAGGPGSRVLPYRTIVPKPLLPVGDRAVLDLVLAQLKRHDFTDVTLAVGDLAPLIRAMFGDGDRHGIRIRYSQEYEPLGTAGALAQLHCDEPFLMMNGTVLTTLDFRAFFDAHEASGNAVTIAANVREVRADFGVLELDGGPQEARVTRPVRSYREKPARTYSVSMGIYAMEPEVRQHIGPDEHLGLPELISRVIAAGGSVGAYRHDGVWLDMSRREDYERAQERYADLAPLLAAA